MIALREQLTLLLIAKSGVNNIHKLILWFDRADFPGKVEKSLSILLEGKFIFVSESNQFNNPIKYAATEQGVDFFEY